MTNIVLPKNSNSLRSRLTSFLLLLALTVCINPAFAGKYADMFKNSPAIDANNASIYIYDLKNNRLIDSWNAEKPLIPASVNKAVTIATAIESAGIDFTYSTKVYADGKIDGNTLQGNLLVVGGGDPSLNSKQDPKSADFIQEIVTALKRRNIKKITGSLVIDQSIFPEPSTPPSWQAEDLKMAYGTGTFGFNFENNASGNSSMRNPSALFEVKLRKALSNAGISMGNAAVKQGSKTLILEHVSPPLDDIMRACMRRSDNMFAETLLRTYAMSVRQPASTAKGADMESDYWKRRKADMNGIHIVDGSGLSRVNRLTAKFLGQVLTQMAGNPDYVSYFPLAGQEGTMQRFLKDTPLDSYIAMKTGSMRGIQCYAGYKLDDNYAPTHVVVVMINNMKSRENAREAVKNVLLKVFENDKALNK